MRRFAFIAEVARESLTMGTSTGFDVPPAFGTNNNESKDENPWVKEVYSPPAIEEKPQTQPVEVAMATDTPGERSATPALQKPDDKSAHYVPSELSSQADSLLSSESNTVRKDLLTKLKSQASNAERIKILDVLLNGKLDNETRKEILVPEASPEKRRVLEDLLLREREIDRRYKIVRETVMKTLPDFREFFLNGQKDQQRQSVYLTLIREDGSDSLKKLKETLGLESNKGRQDKINSLINDKGDLDRVKLVQELFDGETEPRKKQLLGEILKHETNIKLFGRMLDEKPTDETIKAVGDLFKDANQTKRLSDIVKTTEDSRSIHINQLINESKRADVKQELERLKAEVNPAERGRILEKLLGESTDVSDQGRLRQLLEMEHKIAILADLPKEETRRKGVYEALDRASHGDYESVMKAYPLCADWLKQAVPESFVEIGYNMGLPIPPGCPLKLPIEHGKPMPPRLMELYAKEGRIKLDMESNAEKLLNPSEKVENVANLINSVEWLYTTKTQIREKQLRFEADALVDTLKKSFGPEGVSKYGADGIPKGWMPPENVEDIPAWRDRVLQVVNLGNRLRNYAQAMKSIDGIQSSEQGLEDLRKLGVEFEFGKSNQLLKFNIPALDGLDLRFPIPANGAVVRGPEEWLAKYAKDVDKALDPYKEAIEKLIAEKDPKAFLRFGDFPYNEGLHPNIGVPYDLVSQRVTKVEQKGGNVVIEGTVSYQTSSWYSYNYWAGCEPVGRNVTPNEFRQINGLAEGVEPREGEKYKIKGADEKVYDGWTYKGKNADGTLNFSRDESFRIERPASDYIPAMTAMGSVQLVKGHDVDRWLYGTKLESWNPSKWELPQSTFWHHGLKVGKAVMDVGLLAYGGVGIAAKGASWGARAMSFGRMAVGAVGLSHHVIDTKLPKEWRDGIHMASHAFILADVGLGLGASTFKKAFGIGTAARESASLLNTLGHGALAVDGIVFFGPVVASDIKSVIDNHMGWTTQQALDRALDERGTPERLVSKDAVDRPAKYDLKDRNVRESMVTMVDRLGQTLLTETSDAKTKERIEKLIKDGKDVMVLDRNSPKRQQYIAELSKLFVPDKDAAPASYQERLVASALALVLQSNDKGELPTKVLTRQVVVPAHREQVDGRWRNVPQATKEVSVSRDEIVGQIQRLAEASEQHSLKMAAAKLMWRMGKLDHNGLAGVLLDVAQQSNNRELVGMAMIDTKDVSLGFLLNDITHNEVVASKDGFVALQKYRATNYGLTSDDLKRDIKKIMNDTSKGADVRGLAMEILVSNDVDTALGRKAALEQTDRRWQKEKAIDGAYASDLIKALKYQAQQDVPVDSDIVKMEKYRALMALKEVGSIKVDGEDFKMAPDIVNAQLLKCLTRSNIELSLGVVRNIDASLLTSTERRELLSVLSWPNTGDAQRAKVEVLGRIRSIVGSDQEVARETKERLLDMLNPASRARGSDDYSFVGAYPDLHAATITALASFGSQHHSLAPKAEGWTQAEFESRLVDGQTKDLLLGKYYQLRDGDSSVWYRYMGRAQDNKERFIKQGDPTVATIVQHLKDADKIGSAKVRLAVAQAAGDLQIPGLRELMQDAIKKETDPRVARRLREIKFPEELPLDPQSDASIDKLSDYMAQVLANKQFRHLDHYGKWMKETYPLLFDHKYTDELKSAMTNVYGDGFFSGIPWAWDSMFGSKSPEEHWNDAADGVDNRYKADLDKIIGDAKTSKDPAARENSIMALLWVITTRGGGTEATNSEGQPYRLKQFSIDMATSAFLELSKQGANDRGGAVKWAVEKLLTQQPDLHPDHKTVLLVAALQMADADKDANRNDQAMTKEHLAKVLYLTAKATSGFPKPTDGERYSKEVDFHKLLIRVMTERCRDAGATELLEAIAKEHPSPEVRAEAESSVLWLRDGVLRNVVDARKNPDVTSSASQRRDAIVGNLTDPARGTEDVVKSIAKAVEGYQWMKPGNEGNDEILRSALRQVLSDSRVRAKTLASFYLMRYGDGYDMVDAAEVLQTVIDTPYQYANSSRSLKYYKLEAETILNGFILSLDKAPKEFRDSALQLIQQGKNNSGAKKDGVLAHSFGRPDRNKSLATAQLELEALMNNDNANEIDIVRALFVAEQKHHGRSLPATDLIFEFYRRGLEHRSEKVRLASAFALVQSTNNEVDLRNTISVLQVLTTSGGTDRIKNEASVWLNHAKQRVND